MYVAQQHETFTVGVVVVLDLGKNVRRSEGRKKGMPAIEDAC